MADGITRGISFAEFKLELDRRRLLRQGEPLTINAKTFDLLTFLVENNGRVVSKDEILESVWAGQFVEEANLSVQVSALRKALGEKKDAPRFLITVPGKGYKFVADLTEPTDEVIIENRTIERIILEEEMVQTEGHDPLRLAASPARNRTFLLMLACVTFTAILSFGLYKYYPDGSTPEIKSLAVLPFINQNQTADTEYLNDGLAEGVI